MIKTGQSLKLLGVIILSFCAVFICTVFMNYGLDLKAINSEVLDQTAKLIYDGQKSMSSIIIACAGGVMGGISFVVLIFTVSRFINENQPTMGVLKGLGHSSFKIALNFTKFGLSVFIGTALGCLVGFAFSPVVYNIFNDGAFSDVVLKFHFPVVLYLVILPSIIFSLAAFLFALIKLRKPPLDLIRETKKSKVNKLSVKLQGANSGKPFLISLRRTLFFNNLALIFFVLVAGFGFSAQIQIGFLMLDIEMDIIFASMNFIIGIALGLVTFLLAMSYVLTSNSKYLSMLKAYGYTDSECSRAMFSGYRIVSYIGFAIGSVYQFFFMKFMVSLYTDAFDVKVNFNVPGFFITLAAFLICYELIMFLYKRRISKIPLRAVMQA